MMSEPGLTIGIPHLDRSEHLQHAIDSCLRQTVPVCIIVGDQAATERTAMVMDRYKDHPHVRHVITGGRAANLWENWRAVAEECRTPYFAWLQDDDVVSRIYASRAVQAFEAFPEALHFQARCYCSPDRKHAVWWGANGPQVGMDMIDGRPEMWPGGFLLASMFVMSWALSPGVAFRNGEEFRLAVAAMPSGCDLFAERLILAALGAQGPWVADPVVAGYWHHWGGNESYSQNANGSLPRQRSVMIEGLDSILDNVPDWRMPFFQWLRMRSPLEIMGWIQNFECGESRHSDDVKRVMAESIADRVQAIPAPDQSEVEPTIIFDEDAAA